MPHNDSTLADLMETDLAEGTTLLVYERFTGSTRPVEVTILAFSPSKENVKVHWDTQPKDAPGIWMFKREAECYGVVEILNEAKKA